MEVISIRNELHMATEGAINNVNMGHKLKSEVIAKRNHAISLLFICYWEALNLPITSNHPEKVPLLIRYIRWITEFTFVVRSRWPL